MTRDELHRFMTGTLAPTLERAWHERDTQTRRAEQYREEAKREREARKKAERESADKDAEIERLRKALEDSKDTKATDNRDRYGKSSRKTRHSVDKDFDKTPDRSQEKDAFDGKVEKDGSEATEACKLNAAQGKKILTRYKARLDVLMTKLDTLPKIAQTAVNYASSQYPKMSRWREDPDYELDNNFAYPKVWITSPRERRDQRHLNARTGFSIAPTQEQGQRVSSGRSSRHAGSAVLRYTSSSSRSSTESLWGAPITRT